MNEKREYHYKILVVGDLGTGKTSILKRYIDNLFSSSYKSTIGVDFGSKAIRLESNITVNLQMWDIAGQERFGSMTRAYYRGAIGAFVVYDVTRPSTFQNVLKWKHDIDSKVELPLTWGGGNIPIVLMANKIDQRLNSKSEQEMDEFCTRNGFIQWFETSAKENATNIEAAVEHLVKHIVQLESSTCSDSDYKVDYSSSSSGSSINRISLYNDPLLAHKSNCC